ncbi:MAG TPA: signal peptidase I [Thermomicrobiales bacterium]|jgi:signal peptidase I
MTDDDSRVASDGNPAPNQPQSQVDPLGPVSADYAYWPATTEQPAAPVEVEANPPTKPTATKSAARAVREIVETLLLALIIFVAVRALVLNFRVDGNSMVPNLHDHEMLLVNRNVYFHFDMNKWLNYLPGEDREGQHIVYLFHPPQRGDIIVFNPPVASEKPYIKRVIAVAGDTVEIKQDGYVYVNGTRLDEPYIQGPITECNVRKCEPMTVPEGKIYVLGDNRRNSSDSRIFGFVDVDEIIGKAWLTYWPLDDFGLVPHYSYPDIPKP